MAKMRWRVLAPFLVLFIAVVDGATVGPAPSPTPDSKTVDYAPIPAASDPADYGSDSNGNYWQDTILQVSNLTVEKGRGLTTHGHGIIIYATGQIVLDGTIQVHGLGASDGQTGYGNTIAETDAILSAHGVPDNTGDLRLYGAGGCGANGGGYVILHSAVGISGGGAIDVGADGCGQPGIVYLESPNTTFAGTINSKLTIYRKV